MIKSTSCIIIRSELNEWIDICVVPDEYVPIAEVEDVVQKAYDRWHEIDTNIPIAEYISGALMEKDLCCEVYTSLEWED